MLRTRFEENPGFIPDRKTNIQIQAQILGRISRSLAEGLNSRPKVLDMWPDL